MRKIFDEVPVSKPNITKRLVLRWHYALFAGTDTNNAGRFRRTDVASYEGKTEYVLWPDVIPEIDRLLRWYRQKKGTNPVVMSATFHSKFELIHPFIDGNGRIGRLLSLLILSRAGYPMMHSISRDKLTYLRKLEGSQTRNNLTSLVCTLSQANGMDAFEESAYT